MLRPVIAMVVLIAALALSGCGGLNLDSIRSHGDVKIDGDPLDWRGATTWVESPNVAVGVKNDDEYLYLCVSSPVSRRPKSAGMKSGLLWTAVGRKEAEVEGRVVECREAPQGADGPGAAGGRGV